jgi:hypothetical protein
MRTFSTRVVASDNVAVVERRLEFLPRGASVCGDKGDRTKGVIKGGKWGKWGEKGDIAISFQYQLAMSPLAPYIQVNYRW